MSNDKQVSEIQASIDQLIVRKKSLHGRLVVLERENAHNLNTRTRNYRLSQIQGTRDQLLEIDNNLQKQRQLLSESKNIPVDNLSDSLKNLSVGSKTQTNKFRGLEKFINLSSEKQSMFTTPPVAKRHPPVTHSPKGATVTFTKDDMATDTDPITTNTEQTEATKATSSTPVSIVKPSNLRPPPTQNTQITDEIPPSSGLTSTSEVLPSNPTKPVSTTAPIQRPQHKFDFPPTYESAEDRATRMEHERIQREEFEYNMILQDEIFNRSKNALATNATKNTKYTGTIPKTKALTQPISIGIEDDYNMPQTNLSQELRDHNLSREIDENTWNEKIRRFASYKATPDRIDHINRPQSPFNSMNVYYDSFDEIRDPIPNQRRNVRFNSPARQQPNIYSDNVAQQRNLTYNIRERIPNLHHSLDMGERQAPYTIAHSDRQRHIGNIEYDIPNQSMSIRVGHFFC